MNFQRANLAQATVPFQRQFLDDGIFRGDTTMPTLESIFLDDPLFSALMPPLLRYLPRRARMWALYHCVPPILRRLRSTCPSLYKRATVFAESLHLSTQQMNLVLAGDLLLGGRCRGGCSTLGLESHRCDAGGPMLVRALDLPVSLMPINTVRWISQRNERKSIQFSFVPSVGCHTGMNEFLAVAMNVAFSRQPSRGFLPIPLRLSQLLATCRSTEEAANYLMAGPHSQGALISIADRDSDVAIVEICGRESRVLRASDGICAAANHYQHPDFQRDDASNFEAENPHPVLPAIQPSSGRRAARLRELAERFSGAQGRINVEAAIRILRDTGPGDDRMPNDETICRWNPFFRTIGAMVLMPGCQQVYAVSGRPADQDFTLYKLDGPADDTGLGNTPIAPRPPRARPCLPLA